MDTAQSREAFAEGLLDQVEGEIPPDLWKTKTREFNAWRAKCMVGILRQWDQFHAPTPVERARLMRIYCLGVAQGMMH